MAAIGTGAPVLENVQLGGGRDRGASGSAVTLGSAQKKPAEKGLWPHGGSQHLHTSKGHSLINLFGHKLRVKPQEPHFAYEPPALPALAGKLSQELGLEKGAFSALQVF